MAELSTVKNIMINMQGKLLIKGRWAFIIVDSGLGRYFRALFNLDSWGVHTLQPPSNGYHITIASPWDDQNIKYGVQSNISFNYEIEIAPHFNGNCYWYPVYSKNVESWRVSLGLTPTPKIALHYAVGYLYQGKVCEADRQRNY